MVLLLPPAPAARVLLGRALATLSARSAAAFLLMATAGPPGGFGDEGRAVLEPVAGGVLTGEPERGEDCRRRKGRRLVSVQERIRVKAMVEAGEVHRVKRQRTQDGKKEMQLLDAMDLRGRRGQGNGRANAASWGNQRGAVSSPDCEQSSCPLKVVLGGEWRGEHTMMTVVKCIKRKGSGGISKAGNWGRRKEGGGGEFVARWSGRCGGAANVA